LKNNRHREPFQFSNGRKAKKGVIEKTLLERLRVVPATQQANEKNRRQTKRKKKKKRQTEEQKRLTGGEKGGMNRERKPHQNVKPSHRTRALRKELVKGPRSSKGSTRRGLQQI